LVISKAVTIYFLISPPQKSYMSAAGSNDPRNSLKITTNS